MFQLHGVDAKGNAVLRPGSEHHRQAVHMAGISEKLPRNNLRILSAHEDKLAGVWRLWRKVRIAELEYRHNDERRCEAPSMSDEAARLD